MFHALRGTFLETIIYESGQTVSKFVFEISRFFGIFRVLPARRQCFAPKIKQIIETANYVFRGSFGGLPLTCPELPSGETCFRKRNFQKLQEKIKRNSVFWSNFFVTFVKTVLYVSYGTSVWKNNFSDKKPSYFN